MGRATFLGNGRYGSVYGWECNGRDYAIKEFGIPNKAFKVEADAYCCLNKLDALRERIPRFYGIRRKRCALVLQCLREPTLRNALLDQSIESLERIKQFVKKTISIMHSAGVCHGDISLDNIFSSGILFDFSHAKMLSFDQSDTSRPTDERHRKVWEHHKQKDLSMIDDVFHDAVQLHNSHSALAMIELGRNGNFDHAKLAELVGSADGTYDLLVRLKKIAHPDVVLAIAISRIFRRSGQPDVGRDLFRNYHCPSPLSDEKTLRLFVELQSEIAHCQASLDNQKACPMYAEAISQSGTLLGTTDKFTIKLRFLRMRCLEKSLQNSEAIETLTTLIRDCEGLPHLQSQTQTMKEYLNKLNNKLNASFARPSLKRVPDNTWEEWNQREHGSKRACLGENEPDGRVKKTSPWPFGEAS